MDPNKQFVYYDSSTSVFSFVMHVGMTADDVASSMYNIQLSPAPGMRWVEGRLEGPAGGRLGNRLQVQL